MGGTLALATRLCAKGSRQLNEDEHQAVFVTSLVSGLQGSM